MDTPEDVRRTVATVTIDLDRVTLGEMAEVELASGHDFVTLIRAGRATRRLVGLFLHEYRSSGVAPSWRELSDRRPLAPGSSTSPSSLAGTPEPSPR